MIIPPKKKDTNIMEFIYSSLVSEMNEVKGE